MTLISRPFPATASQSVAEKLGAAQIGSRLQSEHRGAQIGQVSPSALLSIVHRLAARDSAGMKNIAERQAELDEISGFILDGEAPIVFKDFNEMVQAWTDLHRLFGVPLSDQECDELCIDEPDSTGTAWGALDATRRSAFY